MTGGDADGRIAHVGFAAEGSRRGGSGARDAVVMLV